MDIACYVTLALHGNAKAVRTEGVALWCLVGLLSKGKDACLSLKVVLHSHASTQCTMLRVSCAGCELLRVAS